MLNIEAFTLIPAIVFDGISGAIAGWILPHLVSTQKKAHFVSAAAIAGGLFGSVPSILHHLFPPPPLSTGVDTWEPGWVPLVSIGILGAASRALVLLHLLQREQERLGDRRQYGLGWLLTISLPPLCVSW